MKSKVVYCKKCGSVIDNDSKKCTGCGKQYFSFKKMFSSGLTWILIIAVIILSGSTYFFYSAYLYQMQKVSEYADKDIEIEDLKSRLDRMSNRYFDLEHDYYKVKSEVDTLNDIVVFTTETGTKYHSYDCFHLSGHITYYMLKEDAQDSGYEPCLDCQY